MLGETASEMADYLLAKITLHSHACMQTAVNTRRQNRILCESSFMDIGTVETKDVEFIFF